MCYSTSDQTCATYSLVHASYNAMCYSMAIASRIKMTDLRNNNGSAIPENVRSERVKANAPSSCPPLDEVFVELDLLVLVVAVDVTGNDDSAWEECRARGGAPQAFIGCQLIDNLSEQPRAGA